MVLLSKTMSLVAASSTATNMPMPGGLVIWLPDTVPCTLEVSFVSILITPLPPAPVKALFAIVMFVVVSSWPPTTTPLARPAIVTLIVLFEKVKFCVPVELSRFALICAATPLIFVNVEFWIDAVTAAVPPGRIRIALFANPPIDSGIRELAAVGDVERDVRVVVLEMDQILGGPAERRRIDGARFP